MRVSKNIYFWRHIETELIIGNNNILHHCIRMFFIRRFCLFLCLFVVTAFGMWFVRFFLIKENRKEISNGVDGLCCWCAFHSPVSIYSTKVNLSWLAGTLHAYTIHNGKYFRGADAAVEIISFDFVTMDVELLSLFVFFCILLGLWIVLLWNLWAHRRK